MSGHSKWSSIKHKKGAADAKRDSVPRFPAAHGSMRQCLYLKTVHRAADTV